MDSEARDADRELTRLVRLTLILSPVFVAIPQALGFLIADPRTLGASNAVALLTTSYAASAIVAYGWHMRGRADANANGACELFLFTALFFAAALTFLRVPDGDYQRDVDAATRWLAGEPFYQDDGTTHPPPTAQLLTGLFLLVRWIASDAATVPGASYWFAVYLVHQFAQLLFVSVLYLLAYRLCRRNGASPGRSAAVATFGLVLAHPLLDALGHNQVSVLVLLCAMGSIDRLSSGREALAGALAAAGGLLKLYPFVLGLEWLLARRVRAIAGACVVIAIVVAADIESWVQWVAHMGRVDVTSGRPRDASLRSVITNAGYLLGPRLGLTPVQIASASTWLWGVAVLTLAAAAVFLVRREERPGRASAALLATAVLCFPLAWSHHYLFVIPLGVVIAAREPMSSLAVIGIALALVAPGLDAFPLGVHRLCGTAILLYVYGRGQTMVITNSP